MVTNRLSISDNIFSAEEHKYIVDYCQSCSYSYGEKDTPDTPPCGMVHNIQKGFSEKDEYIYNLMSNKIENELYPDVEKLTLYRMYVNCFSPGDKPWFHADGNSGLTFIYYSNEEEWNINDGGETQFYIDGMLTGVPPITNRMAIFTPNQLHCAKSFRDRYKFTIATKYE